MSRLRLIGGVLAGAFLAASAPAAEIVQAQLEHEGDHYRVEFEARLMADAVAVRNLLSDYDHLARLSDTVVESRRLSAADGTPRVYIMQRACVLVFCKTLARVMTVAVRPDGDILTLAEPDSSDFLDVKEHWQVIAQSTQTRVRYRAEFVPRFFVPPLIGPWFIKSRIRSELEATAERLETLGARR